MEQEGLPDWNMDIETSTGSIGCLAGRRADDGVLRVLALVASWIVNVVTFSMAFWISKMNEWNDDKKNSITLGR